MTASVTITRMTGVSATELTDLLAVEEPLQIQLLYGLSGKEQVKNVAVTMRTPGNDAELAAGFLFTEGIVKSRDELIHIVPASSGTNHVLAVCRDSFTPPAAAERNFFISSSCGVCGKSSIEALTHLAPVTDSSRELIADEKIVYGLPSKLKQLQHVFQSTGGLHACALFDTRGELRMVKEDVGRHNALDKLIGTLFLKGELPANNMILLLSGRASFEMVQKAAMAGVQIIAAIGAPSSLAVELAMHYNITLIGFLREDRFNIYSYPQRIVQASTHETSN
jgi:FdhD protein